jgi:taurine dioxygenase
MVTLLHAKCPPPSGGDTRFTNMYPPCEALPNVTKAGLKDQKVGHSWELSREHIGSTLSQKEINDAPPTDHPIVRKHTETQTECLF